MRSPTQLWRLTPAVLALLCLASGALADNWPQWRGVHNDGISAETNLPTQWSAKENVAWKIGLPGPGGSTPVIWDDHIFLTSASDDQLTLHCLSTSGEKLWERAMSGSNRKVRDDEGNMASPSPVTDGKHVWVVMGTGSFACFDFEGNEKWKFMLEDRYGELAIPFGMTSTPVLDGDRLYLQLMHQKAALVIALDKATGEEVWRHARESNARAECLDSYASPILYRDREREYLLTHGADFIIAHRLEDGAEIWRCGGFNPANSYNSTLRFVASPVAAEGLIVAPSAKHRAVQGISPDSQGDITESSVSRRWTLEKATPDVPSPLIHDGFVYLLGEDGVLTCVEAKSGRELYNKRCEADRYRASPVFADGKIYCVSRSGVVTVVRAGGKFETLASNEMGEPISSSPAISNGRIYLRTFEALYAIGAKP